MKIITRIFEGDIFDMGVITFTVLVIYSLVSCVQ